ncbi:hypothetical protein CU041_18385 [Thalassospira povalilytica]|uniref:Uncharacterized protein n=1 Tax=Thalassospira povalilytica TaxID=732237 RepID=A0ABX4R4Y4_9PROT|nr:hypothetical protein CU041_18385 [Thalassospira povalilytica]
MSRSGQEIPAENIRLPAGKVARPRCCLVCHPRPQRTLNMIVKYVVFSITSTAVLFVSTLLSFAP